MMERGERPVRPFGLGLLDGGRRGGPWGSGVDPCAEDGDLMGGQGLAPVRHARDLGVASLDDEDHGGFGGLAWGEGGAMVAALERGVAGVEAQAGLLLARPVAGEAMGGKEGRDVALGGWGAGRREDGEAEGKAHGRKEARHDQQPDGRPREMFDGTCEGAVMANAGKGSWRGDETWRRAPGSVGGMSGELAAKGRRHDLDALRAAAMLLGIVYHASLSFALGPSWMAVDVSQSGAAYVFQSWVHGFRMPLFMVVSGYFTAMLWRQKGMKALLGHRCRRVLFPCLAGLVTVVPAMIGASAFATRRTAELAMAAAEARVRAAGPTNLWLAIQMGDMEALARHGVAPGAVSDLHPQFRVTPLTWAGLLGRTEAARWLIAHGAPVGGTNGDGGTALHAAAFMGADGVAGLLLERGADPLARNRSGEQPLGSAAQPFGVVQYIAGLLSIPADEAQVRDGRARLMPSLQAAAHAGGGGDAGRGAGPDGLASGGSRGGGTGVDWAGRMRGAWTFLTEVPVFLLIWFLWFLVWLVGIFAGLAWLGSRLGLGAWPAWVTLSPWKLAWLVPLSAVPGWFMGVGQGEFGPDTVMGIVPKPHVMAYYATFFFFGVLYYDRDDGGAGVGRGWRWGLPLTVLVLFPAAFEAATGTFGLRGGWGTAPWHRPAAVLLQAAFAWAMTFCWMGFFRSMITRENGVLRYLSDSAYWMYLAHLPPLIVLQSLISRWPYPAWLKLGVLSAVMLGLLLASYHWLVRDKPVGWFLNGRRAVAGRRGGAGAAG